jgi:hypothetical protein
MGLLMSSDCHLCMVVACIGGKRGERGQVLGPGKGLRNGAVDSKQGASKDGDYVTRSYHFM